MVDAKLYLDTRRLDKQGRASIRIRISKHGKGAMLGTGVSVLPTQWDGHSIIGHPNKMLLNSIINTKLALANRVIVEKSFDGSIAELSAQQIMKVIKEEVDPEYGQMMRQQREENERTRKSFLGYFQSHIEKIHKKGTRQLYTDTYNKIKSFCVDHDSDASTIYFEDITVDWLNEFQQYCLQTQKQNTASRHLRDIRAVLNAAIDEDLTNVYPFRKFKIKRQESRDKSFSSKELRSLFEYTPHLGGEKEAIDIFKLMFCLIGINCVDLAYANTVIRDRLEYDRRKTGKHYSIRIEPEAMGIIDRYKGTDYMVNILERVPNYKTYFNRAGKNLRNIGKKRIIDGKRTEAEAILPNVCLGSARTSWATIAQEELDIPRDIIQAALGHNTVDVTSTYLRTDWKKKVDAANRKVIDWVLYGKKSS